MKKAFTLIEVLVVLSIILILAAIIVSTFTGKFQTSQKLVTVTKTWIKHNGSQDVYMIGTDQGVFQDSDTWGKTNSSDIYNTLEVGHKYQLEVQGVRNTYFSTYPNIIVATEYK